jgi:lipopolysaccharide biosynthesis regulator YciM
MEIDFTWLLLGLPIAFALGWLASRFDLRQLRIDNRRSPKAYFKGLNHLLNEQQDEAIDAFIEAVQKDPDTSELHFALGNLFRRRGEYDRAVRVHEHLLARGDLSAMDRQRAQYALAKDFLQAGLLDRAEEALAKLEGGRYEAQARLARLAIYERTRDWVQAGEMAQQLQASGQGDFNVRMAHYLCEQAKDLQAGPQRSLLIQARDQSPQSGRAYMALADLAIEQGQPDEALQHLLGALNHAPASAPLVAERLSSLAETAEQIRDVSLRLQSVYGQTRSIDVLQALARLTAQANGADAERELYMQHLKEEPSLIVASRLIKDGLLTSDVERALDQAVKPLLRYRCASCGFEASRHFWQCPGCQSWDSYSARRVEEL